MSGVFLTVNQVDANPDKSMLRPTKGGYPHVTLVYSGSAFPASTLCGIGYMSLSKLIQDSPTGLPTLTLLPENVYINSFFEEKTQATRYDVLIGLSPSDSTMIEKLRDDYVRSHTGGDLSMNAPHITHAIYYSESLAKFAKDEVVEMLPLDVTIVGFTID